MKLTEKQFLNLIGESLRKSIPLAPDRIDYTISVYTKGKEQKIELVVPNKIYWDYRYMWE